MTGRGMTPLPSVTAADALDDRGWFDANPKRRYRVRPAQGGAWIVRRRGRVMLRTYAATLPAKPPASERGIEQLWYATAWPCLTPQQRAEFVRASRPKQRGGKA
jgi:hypothetical protein